MLKHLTRNIAIMAVLTLIMGVVIKLYIANTGTVPAADNATHYTDGSYTATAAGYLSEVTVTVTITGGKVTGVTADASGETPALGGAAAQQLAQQLTETGSTSGVDAVSGSTLTSNAVLAAMEDCMAQAAQ